MSKLGFVMKIRVVQMVFIGLFCLGVSWALCDLAAVYRDLIKISPVSVGIQFAQLTGESRAYSTAESAKLAPMSEPYQALPLIMLIIAIAGFAYLIRGKRAHANIERR